VLNASNARIYKLAWSNNAPMVAIATDNGLLPAPVTRGYIMLAPGERVELWVNFAGRAVGESVKLISRHFEGAENVPVPDALKARVGVEAMMMHSNGAEQGAAMDLATFRITSPGAGASQALPATLRSLPLPPETVAASKAIDVAHKAMTWQFNGRSWDGTIMQAERVTQGSTEVWTFVNKLNPGETMDPMGMAHPIHMHGVHFNIAGRKQLVPELNDLGYKEVRDGFLDQGMKDTFLLMPGEQVSVRVTFAQEKGRYVYHCHNLEHEDQGLMRNYEVI
jgi:FtsP/CotA-like multicopper oxidase with cupredoxin domain